MTGASRGVGRGVAIAMGRLSLTGRALAVEALAARYGIDVRA